MASQKNLEQIYQKAREIIEEKYKELPLSYNSWHSLFEGLSEEEFEETFGKKSEDFYHDYFLHEMVDLYSEEWAEKLCAETDLDISAIIHIITTLILEKESS